MKNIILIALISLFSVNSYALFGLFEEEKRPDPMTLETEEEQMEYFRKYMPETYKRVLEYKSYLSKLGDAEISVKEADVEWKEYEKYSSKLIDVEKEKAENFKRKVEEKEKLKQKVKEMEKDILSKYKIVNGELIKKEDQEDKERSRKEEELLRKRIIEFQKENNMSVLKKGDRIKVKRE